MSNLDSIIQIESLHQLPFLKPQIESCQMVLYAKCFNQYAKFKALKIS
jgi:hypothetical protein